MYLSCTYMCIRINIFMYLYIDKQCKTKYNILRYMRIRLNLCIIVWIHDYKLFVLVGFVAVLDLRHLIYRVEL